MSRSPPLAHVAGQQRRGEVRARDREADAHVAAAVVAEARVDADVDRLARVRERPDPAADVDDLVVVEVDRVDRADHPALRLLDVRGDRGLPERLGDDALEDLVGGLHPAPPLRDDRELEAARVLVELADERVDEARVERRAVEAVERGEDADVGRVAPERAAADAGELLDVVGADVPRPRLERHDVAQLGGRDLLGHHAHERPLPVGGGRDRPVHDRHGGRDERRRRRRGELREQRADARPDEQAERELARPQAEQADERAARDRGEQRRVGAEHEAHERAEQRHEAARSRRCAATAAWAGPGCAWRWCTPRPARRAPRRSRAPRPAPTPSIACPSDRARGAAEDRAPDQRVADLARAAPAAAVRSGHLARRGAGAGLSRPSRCAPPRRRRRASAARSAEPSARARRHRRRSAPSAGRW